MIGVSTYHDQTVLVVGLGRTGLASAEALLAGGTRLALWDDGEAGREAGAMMQGDGVCLTDPMADDADPLWHQLSAIVLSPGIPLTHPEPHPLVLKAKAQGVPVIGDIELFAGEIAAWPEVPVFSITGTNGKSTTTALTGHILNQAYGQTEVGGNIGHAVLDLNGPEQGAKAYVLELSSYQIDLTQSLKSSGAALLNITPDHLDRHGGFDGYVASKRRLFEMQEDGALAVISVDDAASAGICAELAEEGRLKVVPISVRGPLGHGVYVEDGVLYEAGDNGAEKIGRVDGYPRLPGVHNAQNIAVAFALCRHAKVAPGDILAAIESFPGLAHRLELFGEKDGVRFVNDSKATNAEASAHALAAFDNIYWIAGGVAKAGGIESLSPYFKKISKAFLYGECAPVFAKCLKGYPHDIVSDLATAARAAAKAAEDDPSPSVVLLSPAAASFDQFKDFEARGDAFREAVMALGGVQ